RMPSITPSKMPQWRLRSPARSGNTLPVPHCGWFIGIVGRIVASASWRLSRLHRLNVEEETLDFDDADGSADGDRASGDRAPEFAVDADHSFGNALHRSSRDAFRAHQLFAAGRGFPLARAKDQAHEEDRDGGERQGDRQ